MTEQALPAERERVAWALLETLLDYLPSIRTWTGGVVAQAGSRGTSPTRAIPCQRCDGKGHSTPGRPCPACEGRGRLVVDDYTGQPVPVETAHPRALHLEEIDRELARMDAQGGRDFADRRDDAWRHGSYADVAVELDRLLHDDRPGVAYAAWATWAYVVCDQDVPLHDSTVETIRSLVRILALRVLLRTGRLDLPPWLDLSDDELDLQRRRFLWRGHGPAADRARAERDQEMRALRREGVDVGEIGRRFGLSRSRAYEIVGTVVPAPIAVASAAAR